MVANREHYDQMLRQLVERIGSLGDLVAESIDSSMQALEHQNRTEARRIVDRDNEIDQERYLIERDTLTLIATQQPLAGDLRVLIAVLAIATELERIGDYSEGIATLVLRLGEQPIRSGLEEIHEMAALTESLLRQAVRAFCERDLEAAGDVWVRDDEVDVLYERVFRRLLNEMLDDRATIPINTYLLWVAHNVERMADRVGNLAERVAFVVTGNGATFYEGRSSAGAE